MSKIKLNEENGQDVYILSHGEGGAPYLAGPGEIAKIEANMHDFEESDISDFQEYWEMFDYNEPLEFFADKSVVRSGTFDRAGMDVFWVADSSVGESAPRQMSMREMMDSME